MQEQKNVFIRAPLAHRGTSKFYYYSVAAVSAVAGFSSARPSFWWLSVYGHDGRPVTAYTAVWPTAPTGPKNGRMGGGGVGSGQYRGAVVRQLLENQNTKGHWCPVDG